MLYHWSPVARRKSILRHGLCSKKPSVDGLWKPPYLCFSKFPTVAWALSATHSGKAGEWDLWCCWSDYVGPFITRSVNGHWHMTEYRTFVRIPKSKLWHIGTRRFQPRRKHE